MEGNVSRRSLRANLLILLAIIGTLLIALLMAQLDSLQRPLPVPSSLIAQVSTTPTATVTAVILPSPLPTDTREATPTPTSISKPGVTPTATAVEVLLSCGNVPPGWEAYKVLPGDTLYSLAVRSGSTLDEVLQANCLDRNILASGLNIYLPSQPPERVPCGAPDYWVEYTVQPHDTMFSLARSRGTSVYLVLRANCTTSTKLVTGRKILLPPLPATKTPPPPPPPPPANTNTPIPPANTSTPVPPTATATLPPIASATPTAVIMTRVATSTPTPTSPPPPSPTPSQTPIPPSATPTSPPPPPTNTPLPTPTLTPPPTNTPLP